MVVFFVALLTIFSIMIFMSRIKKEDKEKGKNAEKVFSAWLDLDKIPYIYVSQSIATFPKPFEKSLKRPDFVVGIPSVGQVSCDVKCFSTHEKEFKRSKYNDKGKKITTKTTELVFYINAKECENFANYERFFGSAVWYACFDPDNQNVCHIFQNDWVYRNGNKGKNRYGPYYLWAVADSLKVMTDEDSFVTGIMDAIDLSKE